MLDKMGPEGCHIFHFPTGSLDFLWLPDHGLALRHPRLEVVLHGGVALEGPGRLSGKRERFGGKEGLDLVLDVVGLRGGCQVHVCCGTGVLHRFLHLPGGDGPLLEMVPKFCAGLEGLAGGHFERLRLAAFGQLTRQA